MIVLDQWPVLKYELEGLHRSRLRVLPLDGKLLIRISNDVWVLTSENQATERGVDVPTK
jgi:hypothetical protein